MPARFGQRGGYKGAKPNGKLTIRVEPTMQIRLRARAVSEGVGVSEVVRRAIESYLARTNLPRHKQTRQMIDLVGVLQHQQQVPSSVARMYLTQGRVKLNGEVVTDLSVPAPGPGKVMKLEVD